MEIVLRYRGQAITAADVQSIRDFIAAHPGESRWRLSRKLCVAFGWIQPNGALRDGVCRSLLLALHRGGHITLPPVRRAMPSPQHRTTRRAPQPLEVDRTPIERSLRELGPLELCQVRRTADEALFNGLMASEHYLGYAQPVGEQLKFMFRAGERPVALFAWSSAARHLAPRDRYLGWSMEQRRANIRFLAYNTRYLVLPWVKVPHLASHLLSRMTRVLSNEWQKVYGHPVHFAETFVDPERHRGTCYRAANWTFLGRTQGRGKADLTHRVNRSIKNVLGLPLSPDFRQQLLA